MAAGKFAPRPEHVFIGNHTYGVEWLTQDEWMEQRLPDDADAVTLSRLNRIVMKLENGAHESHYQEVLLHEITHAVWDGTMLTHTNWKPIDDGDIEEHVVGMQSPALLFVLKQNPEVVAYILSDGNRIAA